MPPRTRRKPPEAVETAEPAYEVAPAIVWVVRATHAFEDWKSGETRELIPDDRTRGLAAAGFLEVVDGAEGSH